METKDVEPIEFIPDLSIQSLDEFLCERCVHQDECDPPCGIYEEVKKIVIV